MGKCGDRTHSGSRCCFPCARHSHHEILSHIIFWVVGLCVAVAWVRGDTLCTIPNPSHEKLRKQNTLFLFFYGVPLPPPKGTKDQGRKLAPGTGKDIIACSRAEPSGLHPCHRQRNSAVPKERGITKEEGGGWKHTVYRKCRGRGLCSKVLGYGRTINK